MLKNAYLDAKIGFDTAENEPSKVRGFLMGVGGVMRNMINLKALIMKVTAPSERRCNSD